MINPRRKKCIGAVVIAFGVFHGLTLLLAFLPKDWGVNRAIEPYRQLTGTSQNWGMFHTIPTLQSMEVAVEVEGDSFGALLPGLEEHQVHSRIRHYYAFNRIFDPESPYLQDYLNGVADALLEQGVDTSAEFSLRVESDYIRLLKRINEDGEMTLRKSEVLGPYPISRP